ncbi:hypothetical protein [Escherichia coli]
MYPLYALNTAHAIDIRRLPRICFQTKEPGISPKSPVR